MKFLKIHRNYLLNKISIIVIVIVNLFSILVIFAGILSIKDEYIIFENKQAVLELLDQNILFYKLLMLNLLNFIWGNSFSSVNDSYRDLITGYQEKALCYVISKVVFLIALTFIVIFTDIFAISFIGIICGNLYIDIKIIIELFIIFVLIGIIYGFLSATFSVMINSNLIYFLSSGIFVIGELIKESSYELKLYYVFFPSIGSMSSMLYDFGIFHLLCLCIVYGFIFIVLYLRKKI